ncbi:zinc/manganese transport system substrate-binding protein [Formivibrio citricus]|uniref:Zinc/manganese transport system substrate-binding protein n=1 Tax=Formivibrio citricus TaxID=83765 RepID=A0A1I4UWG7_9NEIS|nr:metal ABC transporter substrate-binding protein [Formivibrio citricus]SFM93367.1 zinc/manganese transport system substrate-binding protein [Formivibrio citricus]
MMKKTLLCFSVFAALASALVQAKPLPVAASFSILGDIVQNVGGERIELTTLVGPDQDAHVYQPTPADIQRLTRTRLLFVNGLGFEGWQKRLQQASKYRGQIVTVSQGIAAREANHGHGHRHGHDPHVWQDPVRVKQMVQNIRDALSAADPEGRAYYQTRAANYNRELDQLLEWANQQVATIPQSKRVVLTSHDAFGYLGQRLGIKLLAPQGVSTEAEASARDVARLIQQMKKTGIRAVFMENISNPKLVEQIARDTGTRAGGRLYSDALSRDGAANTYLKMYRHNVGMLVTGMQGNQ